MGCTVSCFKFGKGEEDQMARRVVSASEVRRPKTKLVLDRESKSQANETSDTHGLVRATSTGNSIFDETIVGWSGSYNGEHQLEENAEPEDVELVRRVDSSLLEPDSRKTANQVGSPSTILSDVSAKKAYPDRPAKTDQNRRDAESDESDSVAVSDVTSWAAAANEGNMGDDIHSDRESLASDMASPRKMGSITNAEDSVHSPTTSIGNLRDTITQIPKRSSDDSHDTHTAYNLAAHADDNTNSILESMQEDQQIPVAIDLLKDHRPDVNGLLPVQVQVDNFERIEAASKRRSKKRPNSSLHSPKVDASIEEAMNYYNGLEKKANIDDEAIVKSQSPGTFVRMLSPRIEQRAQNFGGVSADWS